MNKYIVTVALVLIALASITESYIPCSDCNYGKTGGHGDHLGGGGGHADRHTGHAGHGRAYGDDNAQGHRYDNGYDNERYYNSHGAGHDQHHGGYRTHGY